MLAMEELAMDGSDGRPGLLLTDDQGYVGLGGALAHHLHIDALAAQYLEHLHAT